MSQNDRTTGLVGNAGMKVPVRAATTAAIVLSGLQTVDGVVLAQDDRVLVKNQASSVDNGIYVADSGAWSRAPDCDGPYDVVNGSMVEVNQGTVSARLVYICTAADPITIGTTALTWQVESPSSPITLPLSVAQGGTGQSTATAALGALNIMQLTGAGGTANVQTATGPSSEGALAANQLFEYTPAITNTGAVTLTVTPSGGAALAAKNVFYDGAACAGGELVLGVPTLLLYDGVQFNIVGYSRKVRGTQLGEAVGLINGTIVQSRAASAETIAIKTLAGADPSAADPVYAVFRDQAATTGGFIVRAITAALSLVISSGSAMGAVNNVAFRLWYALFDDAGTVRFAAINCLSTVAGAGAGRDVTAIYPLAGWGIASSTAEGGAGAADSAQTFYTGVAVAAKPYIAIGYATWEAGLAAVGTWGTAPSRIQLFAPGVPLPGQPIQVQRTDTGAVATGTTTIPSDDTIPQNTEGDQYMTQAITPSSAANVLEIKVKAHLSNDTNTFFTPLTLFQDAVANALKTSPVLAAINAPRAFDLIHRMLAGLSVSTTFKIRAGAATASTTTFNGSASARLYGGTINSFIEVAEIMA